MIRTSAMVDERVRELAGILRRRGMSVTHQRLAVYRALLEDRSHPDAEAVHQRVRRTLPTISLGTVYKAIDTLKELGAINEVDAPRSATRYEAILEPHHHMICDRCGRIFDLYQAEFTKMRPPQRLAGGFEVTSCSVQFRGTCKECTLPKRKRRMIE